MGIHRGIDKALRSGFFGGARAAAVAGACGLLHGAGVLTAGAEGAGERAGVVTGLVERLTYDVRWGVLSLGRACIENRAESVGGTNRVVRSIEMRNHKWAALLYRIDDRIECVEERGGGVHRACVTKDIREGRFRQRDTLTIDYASREARWEDGRSSRRARYEIPEGVLDYVSLMSRLRSEAALLPGVTNLYRLAMDAGVHELTVSVVDTGSVKTVHGEVAVTRLRIASRSPGLFVRNVPGAVWVSRDPRMVVAMDGRTKVGTVRAVLCEWERNGRRVEWQASAECAPAGGRERGLAAVTEKTAIGSAF